MTQTTGDRPTIMLDSPGWLFYDDGNLSNDPPAGENHAQRVVDQEFCHY